MFCLRFLFAFFVTSTALLAQQPAVAYQSIPALRPGPAGTSSAGSTYRPVRYAGGQEALHRAIGEAVRYPEMARAYALEGTVRVGFRVGPEGQLSAIRLLDSVHPLLDREALRVVRQLEDWLPASVDNRSLTRSAAVAIRFSLP